ncbi:hypothetical protein F5B20DRAFT_566402 [Whalleya microplaca]|nr:hypothetical protein F5B20DRAFT_566402 [Whalleya microplaca]
MCTEHQGIYFACIHPRQFFDFIAGEFPMHSRPTGEDVEFWLELICQETRECLLQEILPHREDHEDLDIAIEGWLEIEGRRKLRQGAAEMRIGHLLTFGPEESSEEHLLTNLCRDRLRSNAEDIKLAMSKKGKVSRSTSIRLVQKIESLSQKPKSKLPVLTPNEFYGPPADRSYENLVPKLSHVDIGKTTSPSLSTNDDPIDPSGLPEVAGGSSNTAAHLPAMPDEVASSSVDVVPTPDSHMSMGPSIPSEADEGQSDAKATEHRDIICLDSSPEPSQTTVPNGLQKALQRQTEEQGHQQGGVDEKVSSNRPAVKKSLLEPSSSQPPKKKKKNRQRNSGKTVGPTENSTDKKSSVTSTIAPPSVNDPSDPLPHQSQQRQTNKLSSETRQPISQSSGDTMSLVSPNTSQKRKKGSKRQNLPNRCHSQRDAGGNPLMGKPRNVTHSSPTNRALRAPSPQSPTLEADPTRLTGQHHHNGTSKSIDKPSGSVPIIDLTQSPEIEPLKREGTVSEGREPRVNKLTENLKWATNITPEQLREIIGHTVARGLVDFEHRAAERLDKIEKKIDERH